MGVFMKLINQLFILLGVILVSACSHPLEIIGQGDIISSTGNNDCALEDQPCNNLVIGDYNVLYTAEPRTGWSFAHWEGCGDQHPDCELNVPASIVNQNWGRVALPLRAVFEPIDSVFDTVEVDGTLWFQPDLFRFLSWNEIEQVCPGGPCTSNMLNDIDMTGWTWASSSDMRILFNRYLGDDLLNSDADVVFASGIERMYQDGWRPLDASPPSISGHTRSEIEEIFGTIASVRDIGNSDIDQWSVNGANSKFGAVNFGAWFYRQSQLASEVNN